MEPMLRACRAADLRCYDEVAVFRWAAMTETSTTAPTTVCVRCGAAIDASRAIYDKTGALMCASCATLDQISEGDARATASLVSTAIAVLLAGLLSWTCLNVFYVLSIGALVGGTGWLTTIQRSPEYKERLGSKYGLCMIAVAFGIFLGSVPLLILLLRIVGFAIR
jgi:hypothetical protein